MTRVATGEQALAADDADLVLLDLGLPDLDGREVCRRLRARTTAPIIVLTARSDELDRVILFELGADDYVVKPFFVRELIARIRAVTRRASGSIPPVREQKTGAMVIDRPARRVFIDGSEITLTPKEFDLLAFLAESPGVVRLRDEIIQTVWDAHWWGPTKTLDVHMAALRKKLRDPAWIETVRGVGFRFVELR